jgi:hypothetical protein
MLYRLLHGMCFILIRAFILLGGVFKVTSLTEYCWNSLPLKPRRGKRLSLFGSA